MLRLLYDTEFCPLSHDIVNTFAILQGLLRGQFPEDIAKQKIQVCFINRRFRSVGVESKYADTYQKNKFRDVLLSVSEACTWIESVKIFVGDEVVPDYSGQTVPDKLALQKKRGSVPEWMVTPMVSSHLEQVYSKYPGLNLSDGFQPDENSKSILANICNLKKGSYILPAGIKILSGEKFRFHIIC